MVKWRIIAAGVLGLGAAIALYSFLTTDPAVLPGTDLTEDSEVTEPGLTLRDVTLEQPDEEGNPMWRVKGDEVTYSPDLQIAYIVRPDGQLFQDGEAIYEVTADTGEVQENGRVIFLRGNIVATGIKNNAILRGNELEWRPDEDRLVIRNQITGSHPQLRASAQEARVYNRDNRMELLGQVVASTVVEDPRQEPWLKLQAEELVWHWEEERIDSPQPLRVEQFKNNSISDVIVGQRGAVDLADALVTLRGQVAMDMLEMPLRVTSDAVDWQVETELVTINQPLTVVHPEAQVRVTARRGRMNLADEVVYLSQDVVAIGQENQSRLTTDNLTWTVNDQVLVAEGRVNYRQVNPTINLNGPRAVGRLDQQTVVVDGGGVVTEIVPN
ncbi:LPS export ABC transporter periplasmic protein LptC [Nodosilinea sp. P-1105]|uniref:LPS export ABC transporter periplasmic protein LptC n=1 Tax=Nodosilinea sp. P-1105 TaxID=2546229 RepID=UPI00146A9144|nr:LPS export ABC transporter periplasmic protein LptC [Nodosilinea sp. P-1105]NMF85423.1 LPS export ABC transporter periplasmic protein LptC [Nodosilinea sp. P-1105]